MKSVRFLDLFEEVVLYFLLFLLPFSIAAIETGSCLLIAVWVFRRLHPTTRPQTIWFQPEMRTLLLAVGFFLLVVALSIIRSDFPKISIIGFVGKWLEYLVLLIVLADLGCRPKVVQRTAWACIGSVFFVIVECATQQWFGKGLFRGYSIGIYSRITGPYHNPIDLATYFSFIILFLVGYGTLIKRHVRWIVWILVFISLMCFAQTLALGAWIGFATGIGLVFMPWDKHLRRRALLLFLLFIIGACFFLYRSGLTHAVLSLSNVGTTDRKAMWQSAVWMIYDRPWLGHGVNTFMSNYLRYWVGGEHMPRYAHNCYLQMAAETGLVGLGAFLAVLGGLTARLIHAYQKQRDLIQRRVFLGMAAGLCAFVIHAGVDTNFYSLRQAALFWIFAGLTVGFSFRSSYQSPQRWSAGREYA